MYSVKEIFYTLQGEGLNAGRAAVFCRFSGCNLWNGKEEDRKSAACFFCDTDFIGVDGPGGGRFDGATSLANAIADTWPKSDNNTSSPFVVLTGGEPLLQVDINLLLALKGENFEIAVETNGTVKAPEGIDWLTVSPKPNSKLVQTNGDELKLVFPTEINPESLANLDFKHFYLSPLMTCDPVKNKARQDLALNYCKQNPQWRLTLQYHKFLNIP